MLSVPTEYIWTNVSCSANKENCGPWNSPFSKYHKLVTQMPQKFDLHICIYFFFLSNSCTACYNYRFSSHQGRGRVLSALEFKSLSHPETNTGERSEFAIYCNVAEGSLAFSQKARDKNNCSRETKRQRAREGKRVKMESVIFRFHCSPPSMFFMSDIKLLLLHPPPVSLSLCGSLWRGSQQWSER